MAGPPLPFHPPFTPPPPPSSLPNNNPFEKAKKQQQQQPLYYPSVFRFKCRGGFSVTSDEPHSRGVCHGIQTQLQHVRDLPKATEEESLNLFLHHHVVLSSSSSYYSDEADGSSSSNNNNNNHHVMDNAILDVPAIVYPFEDDKKKSSGDDNKKNNDNNNNRSEDSTPNTNSTSTEWHDWSTYGSTDVRLLVLRDATTQEEKTVAVAPHCKLGLSVRDVSLEGTTGDTVATVRVGPLEILMRHQYDVIADDDNQEHERSNKNIKNNIQEEKSQDVTSRKSSDKNDDHVPSSNRSISALTFVQGGQRVWEQSQKIGQAMRQNAEILRDATSEDFPQRCWQSSQRIVGEMGKTATKTVDLMQSLYEIWKEDDEDD